MVHMVGSSRGVKLEAESAGAPSSSSAAGRFQIGRLHKRAKLDSSLHLQARHEQLEEPSPLGLRLKKTPSFLDLVQSKLSHDKGNGTRKDHHKGGANSSSSSADGSKLKASNFPASLLRIGDWEYKSRYEGDLVGKCYFAKHKLVWEVLDGGLKNKIEIQWSDIVAIKGVFSEDDDDDQPETLHVVLSRPPLFFRETNPQPRKHTLWQASADFTGGQASVHKQHYLQCQHGFLRKHFEKLVQCDPRLNILSQRQEISLASPCFEHVASAFGDLNEHSEAVDVKSEEANSVSATSLGINAIEEVNVKSFERNGENITGPWCRTGLQGVQPSMSINDLVSYIGHCASELKTGDYSVSIEEITQHLLGDCQFMSDEDSIMSRVNSFCCLLQKDPGAAHNFLTRSRNKATPPQPATSLMKPGESFLISEGEERKSVPRFKAAAPLMSRNNSVGELLLNLPRIASLPRFLQNM